MSPVPPSSGEGSSPSPQLVGFLTVRRAIGGLGALLPFVLWIGAALLFDTGTRDSISAYAHTGMGDVFVGMLCAIAVFFLTYRGYPPRAGEWLTDQRASVVACVSALGVALFPVAPEGEVSRAAEIVSGVHLASAALFFLTLAVFALCLFTKSKPGAPLSPAKRARNRVYRACGWTILAALAALVLLEILPAGVAEALAPAHPVFWLESVAVVAFGVSWLVKGQALLSDAEGP